MPSDATVEDVFQRVTNRGNHCTPRVTRTLRFLLNLGFFFFIPALLLSQEQKLASAPIYTTPLATGVRLDPEGEFVDLSSMPGNGARATWQKAGCSLERLARAGNPGHER